VNTGLLDWLENPLTSRGVRFANDDGGWDLSTYAQLAQGAQGVATLLHERGLQRGDVVSIIVPTGPSFATAFFGTLLAGGTPSPLVPPGFFDEPDQYVSHTASLLATASKIVLTDDSLLEIVTRAHTAAQLPGQPLAIGDAEAPAPDESRPRSDLALLQFTSGSSGPPRGVRVTWENLEANIEMIRTWIGWGPDDAGAHWLPLYHDMGLIGCFLTPLVNQRDLWIMRPEQFVREPVRWLERFGCGAAAFTAGPNFCFAYAAKKLNPEQIQGMDFSNWRAAIVGAERLDPAALATFAAMLEPYGFRRDVFLPAYGLAEATLAVSINGANRVPRVIQPDWDTIDFAKPVSVSGDARLGEKPIGDGAGWLVGCGQPLPGVRVMVGDEYGRALPDRTLGELIVEGPTVASGYAGTAASSSTRLSHGVLHSGDAGFTLDGEVFVTGRIGDALKVRGRTLYAEDLESKLFAIDQVPTGRCVVVPGMAEGSESVAVIVEAPPGAWVEEVWRVLGRETHAAHVTIYTAPRGTLQRTSSGKPRRRVIWRALVSGALQLQELDAAPSDAAA
jgi:acyl-CoA synthetase (AMP-forming)/AMP-acid ligase II